MLFRYYFVNKFYNENEKKSGAFYIERLFNHTLKTIDNDNLRIIIQFDNKIYKAFQLFKK